MLYLLVLCVAVTMTQAIPAPGHGLLTGYCMTSHDCAVDECCVSVMQPKGRRSTQPVLPFLDPDLLKLVKGYCAKRYNRTDHCIIPHMMPHTDGLYYDCPCAAGLVCQGTGQMALYKGELGVCADSVSKRSAVSKPCHSGSDCAADECCVSNVRPLGKRQVLQAAGHCQPMGKAGSGCLVRYPSGKPAAMAFQCPCSSSLTCNGNGMFDIPLGETGTCGI